MKRLAAMSMLLACCAAAGAQQPFDMSAERETEVPGAAAPSEPQPQPVSAAPPAVAAPPVDAPDQITAAIADARRYVVPFEVLTLAGETDRRAWSIYLTPEQAAAGTEFSLGYQNAIFVAPEASKLRVVMNGATLFDIPVQSTEQVTDVVVPIPPGTLKAGFNAFSIETTLRHRTDCSVQSTYDLWAEIDPSRSFIAFNNADAVRLRRLEDIAAVGVDDRGATAFRIVAPALDVERNTGPIVQLAEGLALTARMPAQSFSVERTLPKATDLGMMTIVVGTPGELSGIIGPVPLAASSAPVVGFIDDPLAGPSTLLVSGPTWDAIEAAVGSIVTPVDQPVGFHQNAIVTKTWRIPDAPMLDGANELSLADLGATTQEFSGRRFRTEFAFGVPYDFYANAYGEATLLLDAAYSPAVQPGSHIDVYVNGDMAATVPITRSGGEILRHFPVPVTMRHFRPGVNVIAMEALLTTQADQVCAPGASASTDARFVLFDTTMLEMPAFARIARRPDLSEMAGAGFPYGASATPAALVVPRADAVALSAAATMLARMSVAAGRVIRVNATATAAADSARDAIFVGAVGDIAPDIREQFGLAADITSSWGGSESETPATGDRVETDATFDKWRKELSGSGWRGRVSAFEEWLYRNFDLTLGSLNPAPRQQQAYAPSRDVSMILAQQLSPDQTGIWTIATAPSTDELASTMQGVATADNWSRIAGRVAGFDGQAAPVGGLPSTQFRYEATQPASFSNYRLIAANWLSGNVLSFTGALVLLCALLGLTTATLLSVFGRRR